MVTGKSTGFRALVPATKFPADNIKGAKSKCSRALCRAPGAGCGTPALLFPRFTDENMGAQSREATGQLPSGRTERTRT